MKAWIVAVSFVVVACSGSQELVVSERFAGPRIPHRLDLVRELGQRFRRDLGLDAGADEESAPGPGGEQ